MSDSIIAEGSFGFGIRVRPNGLSEAFSSIRVAHLRVLDITENTLDIWPCTIDAEDESIAHIVLESEAVSAGRYKAELYIETGTFAGVVGEPFTFRVRKILVPR